MLGQGQGPKTYNAFGWKYDSLSKMAYFDFWHFLAKSGSIVIKICRHVQFTTLFDIFLFLVKKYLLWQLTRIF